MSPVSFSSPRDEDAPFTHDGQRSPWRESADVASDARESRVVRPLCNAAARRHGTRSLAARRDSLMHLPASERAAETRRLDREPPAASGARALSERQAGHPGISEPRAPRAQGPSDGAQLRIGPAEYNRERGAP